MFMKIDEPTKHLVEEISALSGIQKEIIREVWEYTLFRWVEQLTRDPEKLQILTVPFLGSVGIKYQSSSLTNEGSLETVIESFISPNVQFKELVGDIYDEKSNILVGIFDKKIHGAIEESEDS